MVLAVEAETKEQGLVRAQAVAEVADLAPEVGAIRVAVQEVAGLGPAVETALAREVAGVGLGRVAVGAAALAAALAMAEPRNGFLPHRCYMARRRAEDRGLVDPAVPAASSALQRKTSARC